MRLDEINKYEPKPVHQKWDSEEKILKFIRQYCKPWLAESQGRLAYRGIMKVNKTPFFTRNVRTDRTPMNTGPITNDLYNTIIAKLGGVANRSNSIFVTGKREEASGYGKAYIVFPIGNFNYTWSPAWADWYFAANTIVDVYQQGKIKGNILVDEGLGTAIASGHEIMISCKKVLFVDPNAVSKGWEE